MPADEHGRAVAQVGGHGGAGLDRRGDLFTGGLRMADADHYALAPQRFNVGSLVAWVWPMLTTTPSRRNASM